MHISRFASYTLSKQPYAYPLFAISKQRTFETKTGRLEKKKGKRQQLPLFSVSEVAIHIPYTYQIKMNTMFYRKGVIFPRVSTTSKYIHTKIIVIHLMSTVKLQYKGSHYVPGSHSSISVA